MDQAIVLQARMGSTRLPGKALADVDGRPLIWHCIERLRASGLPVVLATTERPDDDMLAAVVEKFGVRVVRGPDRDVLARYAMVAAALGLTTLVRATGDNPAVDIEAPRRTLALLERIGADHVVERGLPYGAAVEAIAVEALMTAADLATDPYDREHVTPFIRRDPRFRAVSAIAPGELRRPGLRLTVDTADDLDFMRRLYAAVTPGASRPAPLVELMAAADRCRMASDGGSGSGARSAR